MATRPRRAESAITPCPENRGKFIFDEHERGPQDDLALAFEATRHLTPQEQATVRELIEAMLLKHEARRWAS